MKTKLARNKFYQDDRFPMWTKPCPFRLVNSWSGKKSR